MNDQASSSTEAAKRRLRAAFTATHPDESEIRTAVCAFVDVVKPLGWPVERILVDVKGLATGEDSFLFRAWQSSAEQRAAEGVLERAVTWCIEHYFWTPPNQ
jgi:hypothetical protein